MEETTTKCLHEIDLSQKVYKERTKKISMVLINQKKNIKELADAFLEKAQIEPWVFQKCSIRGLYMVK